ncbi:MAG: hypothetical protein J2P30_00380 [Actinobacteria bacterium]|nr:hypothetical protein [Actinomycetota bacterium]
MTTYQMTPRAMEAHQWWQNGDHPADNCRTITPDADSATQFEPFQSEGEVVRYFRRPDIPGDSPCPQDCGFQMHSHGWIDQGGGRTVCPGDWVVSFPLESVSEPGYFPVKPDVSGIAFQPAEYSEARPDYDPDEP